MEDKERLQSEIEELEKLVTDSIQKGEQADTVK